MCLRYGIVSAFRQVNEPRSYGITENSDVPIHEGIQGLHYVDRPS